MLFLAGQFILLNDVERERKFKETIESKGIEYKRLVSFFFPKTTDTLMQIAKEEECKKNEKKEN